MLICFPFPHSSSSTALQSLSSSVPSVFLCSSCHPCPSHSFLILPLLISPPSFPPLFLFSSLILSTFFILHFPLSSILPHAPHHPLFACPSSPSTSYHLPSLLILPNLTFHIHCPFHHLPSPSPSISYFFLHLSSSCDPSLPIVPHTLSCNFTSSLSLSHVPSACLTILCQLPSTVSLFLLMLLHFSPPSYPSLSSKCPTNLTDFPPHPSLTSSHPSLPHSSLSNWPYILLHLLPLS